MNSVVAQRPAQKPIELIRSQLYLPSMQEQLKSALPPHGDVLGHADRVRRRQHDPELADADALGLHGV